MKKKFAAYKIPKPLVRPVEIGKILINDMNRCDLFKHASAMAYVTLFSLIPSLAATFALISLFKPFLGEEGSLYITAKQFVLENLAAGSGEQVINYFESFIMNLNLTKIGITGFAATMVTLVLLLRQIEIALNRIWMVKKERNIFTRFIYFWTFLTFGTFVIGMAIGIISGFNVSHLNPFGDAVAGTIGTGVKTFFTTLLSSFIFFVFIYKIVPNTTVALKDAAWGALTASTLFTIASKSFGFYTSTFTNYQAVYGALAAVPVFLFWLYVLWLITIFGALITWRSQQGFALDEDMDDDNVDLTPKEKFRNHKLQAALPYLVVLIVYQRFLSNEGKGVTGQEISSALNFPAPWIIEAIEALLAMRLIVAGTDNQNELNIDVLQNVYFPTIPAQGLTLEKLHGYFSAETQSWLQEWQHNWPTDVKPALEKLWQLEAKAYPKTNLAEVLQALPGRP